MIDLTGQIFGKLTVIRLLPERDSSGGGIWEVQCSCPKGKIWGVAACKLKAGKTKSCGCAGREERRKRFIEFNTKHGLSKATSTSKRGNRLYHIHRGMVDRCYTATSDAYQHYGGRGITICDEWLVKDEYQGLLAFVSWAEAHPLYRLDYTVDRIDVNGPYSPENCTWASVTDQNNNTTKTIKFMYQGVLSNWLDVRHLAVVDHRTFKRRIKKGWPAEKALLEPIDTRKGQKRN